MFNDEHDLPLPAFLPDLSQTKNQAFKVKLFSG